MENFPDWSDILLALIFGIAVPFISGVKSAAQMKETPMMFDSATKKRFYIGNSLFLAIMGVIILISWLLHSRPFSRLGFNFPSTDQYTLCIVLTFLFVGLYIMDVVHGMLSPDENEEAEKQAESQTPFLPAEWNEIPSYFVMCLSAGVFEEIVYRGFLVTFFQQIFSGIPSASTWALLTPALVFSLAHYYQGPKAVFKILVLSLLFGMIFWYSQSLLIVIILHTLIDLSGGILSIIMAKKKLAKNDEEDQFD